jgi:hypothetical protein
MSGIDRLAVAAAPAPAGADAVFVAAIAADPEVIEALLVERLLEAIVTAAPQRGTVFAETPRGPVSLATPQPLPPATALLLRPASEPGRAIVTVLPPPRRPGAAALPSSARGVPPAPPVVVALDSRPAIAARVVGESRPGQPPAFPPGSVLAVRIVEVIPPAEPSPEWPAGSSEDTPAEAADASAPARATEVIVDRFPPQPGGKRVPMLAALPPPLSGDQPAAAAALRGDAGTPPTTRDLAAAADPAAGRAGEPNDTPEPEDTAEPGAAGRRSAPPEASGKASADPAAARRAPSAERPAAETRRTGTVVSTTPTETIVDTELGRLAMPAALDAPRGSLLIFSLVRAPAASPLPAPDGSTPATPERAARQLEQALDAARAAAPELVGRLERALQPGGPERILAALVNFVAASRGRALDPIAAVAQEIAGPAHREAAAALREAAAALAAAQPHEAAAPFQPVAVPLMDGPAVQMLTIYLPHERDGGGGDAGEADASRFAVEVELSRLGALQLDGLVRSKRLDLVLRSRRALPVALRQELAAAFRDSLAASGFAGEIAFAVSARFPIGAARRPLPLSISV